MCSSEISQGITSEEEQTRKFVKLIYWQNGLLYFINQIFGLIGDKCLKDVNYYFILKDQIKQVKLDKKLKKLPIDSTGKHNGVIIEDSREENIS
jgi:hypothetical protein